MEGTSMAERGLSPRVRGNRGWGRLAWQSFGSIPACAGEPPTLPRGPAWRKVYPRVCGGTLCRALVPFSGGGLSPRVRGNLCRAARPGGRRRSIPACAGEPVRMYPLPGAGAVYPRVCGGTPPAGKSVQRCEGLSPRVRGNRAVGAVGVVGAGSIPACAGEPSSDELPCSSDRGLSPRVRGNQKQTDIAREMGGSIPACAGEPHRTRIPALIAGVYPRVCGGT